LLVQLVDSGLAYAAMTGVLVIDGVCYPAIGQKGANLRNDLCVNRLLVIFFGG
jgi:hypothetical protein